MIVALADFEGQWRTTARPTYEWLRHRLTAGGGVMGYAPLVRGRFVQSFVLYRIWLICARFAAICSRACVLNLLSR